MKQSSIDLVLTSVLNATYALGFMGWCQAKHPEIVEEFKQMVKKEKEK